MNSKSAKSGRINVAWVAFLGSVVLFVGMLALLLRSPESKPTKSNEPLLVYCAAGIKAPVESVARQYEQACGVPVQLQYGGSQTLLANIEVSKRGDLYLPGDESYIQFAREKGLLAELIPLAEMRPVLAVQKGNPKQLKSLDDLLQRDFRLAQANPDAAAVGKLTREALTKTGQWDALRSRTTVFKGTVNDVANDLKIGAVDAGIIWDATLFQYPDLEQVPAPQLDQTVALVSISVLQCSPQPTAALRFARFLSARDRGLKEFGRYGFRAVEGDMWSERPEIRLLAGAVLRPAIETTLTAFEEREGVRVTRVYNGCGILVSQMRVGERPDAYFACDVSFMNQVQDLFLDTVDVSTNQLVILVHKGNPHGVKSLKDLGKPGLRVGVGHEKQCALGALTQQTLIQDGSLREVMKNVVVQSPTGDFLVNQLRTGSLDAVVAYISNATTAAGELDAIAIDVRCAIAAQPIAVGRESQQKQLGGRLVEAIRSKQSRERFESAGFRWKELP